MGADSMKNVYQLFKIKFIWTIDYQCYIINLIVLDEIIKRYLKY